MHNNEQVFNAIPWCSRLLAASNLRTHAPHSRTPKPLNKEDTLFSDTFKSASTISAALCFYPRPQPSDPHVDAVSTLFTLGDGMNGFPSVLHGGIVSTLIDEAMGVVLGVNADREHVRLVATGHDTGDKSEGIGAYTAQLNIKYMDKVKTPGVVLVKARVTRRQGRKIWMRAVVVQKSGGVQELDGSFIECAVGEALFVKPRGVKL